MTETIICALITGGLTLMGVLIANGAQQLRPAGAGD